MGSFSIIHLLVLAMFIGVPVLILALVLGRSSGRDQLMVPPRSAPRPDLAALTVQVQQMLASGHKIEAIKVVREATGMDLKAAKDWVESLG